MADTVRNLADILALFADNDMGEVSPQDMRDYVVSARDWREDADWSRLDNEILKNGFRRTGVEELVHCAVTAKSPAEMKVHVAIGYGIIADVAFESAAGDLTVADADPTYPRIDLVYLLSSGKNISAGTPAVNPKPPSYPANSVVLALVNVAAGATSITSADIVDKRVVLKSENNITFIPASSFIAYEGSPTLSMTNGYPVWLLDKATAESIIAYVMVPSDFRPILGGNEFGVYVEHVQVGATTGVVRLESKYKLGTNLGAAFTTVAANLTVNQGQHVSAESAGIAIYTTVTDVGLVICIRRDAAHTNDTLDTDWGVLGVSIKCWELV